MLLTANNPAPSLFWVLAVPVIMLLLCIVIGTVIFEALTRLGRR